MSIPFGKLRAIFLVMHCNCISGFGQAAYQEPVNGFDSLLFLVHSVRLFQQSYISLPYSQPERRDLNREKSISERLWEAINKARGRYSALPVWEEQNDDESQRPEPDDYQPLSELILAILSESQAHAYADEAEANTNIDSRFPDTWRGEVIYLPVPMTSYPDTSKEPESDTEKETEESQQQAEETTTTTQQLDINVDSVCFQQFIADEIRPKLEDKNYPAGTAGGNFGCVENIRRLTMIGYVVIKSVRAGKAFPEQTMDCIQREISAYKEFAKQECQEHKGSNNVASLIGWLTEYEVQTEKVQRIVLILPDYGLALDLYVLQNASIPINTIHWILQEIAQGLSFIHSRQLIHCDLKPANCLINSAQKRVVLIDFGFILNAQEVADGSVKKTWGTWCYLAPEIVRGEKNSIYQDIWSYGIIAMKLAELCSSTHIRQAYLPYRMTIDELCKSHAKHQANYKENNDQEELQKQKAVSLQIGMIKSGLPKRIISMVADLESGTAEELIDNLIVLCLDPDPEKRIDTTLIIEMLDDPVFKPECESESDSTTCATCVLL